LEHTRHQFLRAIGLDFNELHHKGIDAVVARVDLAYKSSLRSGDRFFVTLRVEHEGLKYLFYQNIFRLPDEKLCLKGVVTTTSLVNGRLALCDEIIRALEKVKAERD
ncbi:MAG TPA: acyl-CoA thioesterase, partial [Prolixibacteraceae bacterium]|nr:acyl-CoA thioesterase [Prolixibacteraceae bacterium]